MSTYMYLKCLDHDPPLVAEDESGQHHYDLPRIRAEIAGREALVALLEADGLPYATADHYDNYFPRHSARFLRGHPSCRVGIVTEYGEDVTEGDE